MTIRTTLTLDEDVYRAARSLANAKGCSLGTMLSEMARQALRPPARRSRARRNAFPTFEVSKNIAPLTMETVRAALADDPR